MSCSCGGKSERAGAVGGAAAAAGTLTASGSTSVAAGASGLAGQTAGGTASAGSAASSEEPLSACSFLVTDGASCFDATATVCRCEDHPDPACVSTAYCRGDIWEVESAGCAPLPATPCPESIEAASLRHCLPPDTQCSYPADVSCYCVFAASYSWAEFSCGASPTLWYCGHDYPAGCPEGVPDLGSPCESEGLECGFACDNPWARLCRDGMWQEGEKPGECI